LLDTSGLLREYLLLDLNFPFEFVKHILLFFGVGIDESFDLGLDFCELFLDFAFKDLQVEIQDAVYVPKTVIFLQNDFLLHLILRFLVNGEISLEATEKELSVFNGLRVLVDIEESVHTFLLLEDQLQVAVVGGKAGQNLLGLIELVHQPQVLGDSNDLVAVFLWHDFDVPFELC